MSLHIYIYIHIVIKMPQKLTTTACFIQEESSGGESSGGRQKVEDKRWKTRGIFRCFIQEESSGLPPEDSSWMKQAVVVSF